MSQDGCEMNHREWLDAWGHCKTLDDEAWDTEAERLDQIWKRDYLESFVLFAVERGWSRENAETWADEIVDDALIEARGQHAPQVMAHTDVISAEWETENSA